MGGLSALCTLAIHIPTAVVNRACHREFVVPILGSATLPYGCVGVTAQASGVYGSKTGRGTFLWWGGGPARRSSALAVNQRLRHSSNSGLAHSQQPSHFSNAPTQRGKGACSVGATPRE